MKRVGCLGFLVLLALGICAFAYLVSALFAPWIFTVGNGRKVPFWAGVGVAQAPAGTFTVFIWFAPTSSGSKILPSASISGSGYVCTPTGQRYWVKLAGGASGRIWKAMDGHTFAIRAYDRPVSWNFGGDRDDWRPYLTFKGKWTGPDLVMDDQGSFARMFTSTGALNKGKLPAVRQPGVPITFIEKSWWLAGASCSK